MEPAEVIEIPSSPSDQGMNVDMGNNSFAIERSTTAMPRSIARSDPQQISNDARILEMEAEVFRLRTLLDNETMAGQQRAQEVFQQTRSLARQAIAHTHEEFLDVAHQYEHASAEATEAAVYKERSNQELEQHRQLNFHRDVLHKVEEAVAQREYTLKNEVQLHEESMKH